MNRTRTRTFAQWKQEVEEYIEAMVGLSADDLPDFDYYSWYEDGASPRATARAVIRAAME